MDDDSEHDAEVGRPDFELEALTPLAPLAPARWRPARSRRRVRPLTAGAGLALLVAVMVVAVSLHGADATPQDAATTRPAPTPTDGALAVLPVVTPNGVSIGEPPSCSLGPAPDTVTYFAQHAFGGAPLWVSGFDDAAQRVVHLEGPLPRLLTPRGWAWRVLLVTDLRYLGPVTVTGDGPGGPLLFAQGTQAVASLALDTRAPAWTFNGWGDWVAYIFLPGPGCYGVRATWPGGGWRVAFAAGR
jgi:hypothetical protein